MSHNKIQLEKSWLAVLEKQFSMDYMHKLRTFLVTRKKQGVTIYPQAKLWFNALNLTPFDKVKVIILGQDPYHGFEQAHGLSFSVLNSIKLPPSLVNIFTELYNDLSASSQQVQVPPLNQLLKQGDLTRWATQGVLLLNSVLTVEAGKAASHANQGWEQFTDEIIYQLNHQKEHLVFILWGNYAQKKGTLIDKEHLVIRSSHPSPFSSHQGFFGSKPFSKTNQYLSQHGHDVIKWC